MRVFYALQTLDRASFRLLDSWGEFVNLLPLPGYFAIFPTTTFEPTRYTRSENSDVVDPLSAQMIIGSVVNILSHIFN